MRASRLALIAAVLLAVGCGIKAPPKPTHAPPPKKQAPAAVQPLPEKDATTQGALDAGLVEVDAGTPDAG